MDYRDEHGRTHRERADFCVAAMPPHLLARLRHNLGTPVQLALTRPHPLAVGKMGLEYGRRWWEEDERIFGGITTTDLDVEPDLAPVLRILRPTGRAARLLQPRAPTPGCTTR